MHPPYCRSLTGVTAVLFTFNLQTKFEMQLHPLQRWPGPKTVEIGHVTLTLSTWGIVGYRKAKTSRGQLVYEI